MVPVPIHRIARQSPAEINIRCKTLPEMFHEAMTKTNTSPT
jgi:hypothetical protein